MLTKQALEAWPEIFSPYNVSWSGCSPHAADSDSGAPDRAAASLHDAERQVRHSGRADHPRAFELDVLRTHPLEQPGPVAQQDGHQVDPQLVDQSGPDELPDVGVGDLLVYVPDEPMELER